MIGFWQVGAVFGLVVLGGAAVASAQVPGSPNQGVVGISPGATSASQVGRDPSLPANDPSSLDKMDAGKSASSRRRLYYDRVTTLRRGGVSSPSVKKGAPSGGPSNLGRPSPYDPLRSYTDPQRSAGATGPRGQVPIGSSWQAQPRAQSQPVMNRSSSHNYYPTKRNGRAPNPLSARIAGAGTGTSSGVGVSGLGMGMMMGRPSSAKGLAAKSGTTSLGQVRSAPVSARGR
jgi:hypothetical protein